MLLAVQRHHVEQGSDQVALLRRQLRLQGTASVDGFSLVLAEGARQLQQRGGIDPAGTAGSSADACWRSHEATVVKSRWCISSSVRM